MEEEFVANQERLKPPEEKAEENRSKVDDLRACLDINSKYILETKSRFQTFFAKHSKISEKLFYS